VKHPCPARPGYQPWLWTSRRLPQRRAQLPSGASRQGGRGRSRSLLPSPSAPDGAVRTLTARGVIGFAAWLQERLRFGQEHFHWRGGRVSGAGTRPGAALPRRHAWLTPGPPDRPPWRTTSPRCGRRGRGSRVRSLRLGTNIRLPVPVS
jgi:hypothetical protein